MAERRVLRPRHPADPDAVSPGVRTAMLLIDGRESDEGTDPHGLILPIAAFPPEDGGRSLARQA